MATLKLMSIPEAPLELDAITPDALAGKTPAEIAALPLPYGNQQACVGDFFGVSDGAGPELVLEGDLSRVKLIGAGLAQGQIIVRGNAGMHLGAGMRGGQITVFGNAADWAGAEMRGGQITIHGNAGHGLGAGYRGSAKGMKGGVIVVTGNAGNEAGSLMRRGLIAIGGDSGDFTGSFVIAGTILVFGRLGERAGAGLKRGTIVATQPPRLLPTYRYSCMYEPGFLRLLLKQLAGLGLDIDRRWREGRYRRYCGDLTALGKGEILVWEGA